MPADNLTKLPWPRILAEFGVIVIGVLVALAVDAAWDAREEERIERAYLEQLLIDLDETAAPLAEAIALEERVDVASRKVLDEFAGSSLPPDDSLQDLVLQTTAISTFRPVLGTLDALVETGDLRLIERPSLRTSLLRYRSLAQAYEDEKALYTPMTIHGFQTYFEYRSPGPNAVGLDFPELAQIAPVRGALLEIGQAARNRLRALRKVRAGLEEAREEIILELEEDGPAP